MTDQVKPLEEEQVEETVDVTDMDKDQLEAFAKKEFKIDLDKRKKHSDLLRQVQNLMGDEEEKKEEEKLIVEVEAPARPAFWKHPRTGNVFADDTMVRRVPGMIPCDEDGKSV
jgi:hypothetical protein